MSYNIELFSKSKCTIKKKKKKRDRKIIEKLS